MSASDILRRQFPQWDCTCGGRVEGVVIDTNVFVAAGFNSKSAAARVFEGVREGRFRLIWNEPTRRETEIVAWPAADPSHATGRVNRHDNQLLRSRVLQVRIQSPPAVSLQTIGS